VVLPKRIDQLGDLGLAAPSLDCLRDTGLKVILQQNSIYPLQGGLCSRHLLHQLRAIHLGLDHSDDPVQVAAHRLQTQQRIALMFWVHMGQSKVHPSGVGI
jgi:hypothetical protein